MKKILLLISVCLTATMVSCQFEKDIDLETYGGKGLEFVHFSSPSDGWVISESDPSFVHEVEFACTYVYDKDVTYKISVGEGSTGVVGTDFRLVSNTATIRAGEYTTTIPVEVLYETTGLGFDIELVLDVEDEKINPSYGASSVITVKTDKVTIDWEWLVGNWTAQDASGGNPYIMQINQIDDTTAEFVGEYGCSGSMTGTVDFDARVVTFTGSFDLEEAYGGMMTIGPVEGETFTATLSPLGIVISGFHVYLVGGSYDGFDWGEEMTTLTR